MNNKNKINWGSLDAIRYLACAKQDFKPKEEKPIFIPRNYISRRAFKW